MGVSLEQSNISELVKAVNGNVGKNEIFEVPSKQMKATKINVYKNETQDIAAINLT